MLKRVSANDADAVVVSAGWTSESRLLPKSSKRDASTLKRVSDTPGIDEAESRAPLKSSRRDVSMLKRVSDEAVMMLT